MTRLLALAALLTLASVPAGAQQPVPVIRLALSPRAEPVPALKYPLLPPLRERHSGNALLLYYRAFSPEWQAHRRTPHFLEKVSDANEKPLRDLAPDDVKSLARGYSSAILTEVDRGARRSYCDWEMDQRIREDGIAVLLPDIQAFREFTQLLKMRARQELLAGEYDRAARSLQTGLTLARHATEGPSLIHNLVGVACAAIMLTVVDDWVERPDAPNLYWALTDLPHPLLSMRKGIEGERLFIDWLFPGYRELLDNPAASPATGRVQTSLQKYAGMLNMEGDSRTWGPLLAALRTYPRARRFLREKGRSDEQIEAMPALQVVFLYEIHKYDVAFDDLRKWASLPYPEAAPHVRRAVERTRVAPTAPASSSIAALLLPAVDKVLAAPVRVERKLAALRVIEALRLHAASNGGKLPERLEAVTEVPIPLDPFTGKPFAYRVEGEKAVLSAEAPAGQAATPNNTLRYELTLRTPKRK
jgi:hypothetical protein